MIALTPKWVMYDEFWRTLKRRNLWIIKLRYVAIALLLSLMFIGLLVEQLHVDRVFIAVISVSILLYNVSFHRAHRHLPEGYAAFNGLHFALLQMSLDFVSLLATIYLTGGVESPFFYFFIFHVIIGSLILPRNVVTIMVTITIVTIASGAWLELHGSIPHIGIQDFLAAPLYLNQAYVISKIVMLMAILYVSNYLANSISKELYMRERALTIAYKKLEEAETAKSRYVMSVVHDLKTPIAAAMTYLNMILDGSLGRVPDALERPLERSRIRLNNAISIVNDILQLSQLKLAEKPVISRVNLTELIDEIYQEMRILFVAKKIRFSTWINSEEDIFIEAERKLLKLGLSNLISNTHKYTEKGGRVEIHIKDEEEQVIIEISDSGIGIPKDEQQRIFQDFYRSSISKKKGIEGTGLGMSVVLHIIRQFKGAIDVTSPSQLAEGPEHPGTAFFITLPKIYSSDPQDTDEVEI